MTKATTDQYGRHSYKNYTIEPWYFTHRTGVKELLSYSIYNRFNSMYDNKDGFKSVEEAVQYIDKYRD